MMTDFAQYLLTIPVGQLKAIKRAVAVLVRAGFPHNEAVDIIVSKHMVRMEHHDTRLRAAGR